MAKKTVGQVVTRPGRLPSDPPVTIPIPEDLMTVPGAPVRQNEVDFYSREYPIESQNVDYSADRQWAMTVLTPEAYAHRKEHEHHNAPLVAAARHTGEGAITIRLRHAGGLTVEQTLPLIVRPPSMPVTTRLVVDLGPNGGSLRVDRELLAASLLEGASVSVGVSQSASFDVPSVLMALDRYPYGCAEQTTSRALPSTGAPTASTPTARSPPALPDCCGRRPISSSRPAPARAIRWPR